MAIARPVKQRRPLRTFSSSIIETIENLEASDLPRVQTEIDGEPFTIYTLDTGATFAVPDNWNNPFRM